jgi:hypothetical protein
MIPTAIWCNPEGSYLQGYNCQLAVDRDHQVIVAVGVSNQPPDVEHLVPILQWIAATAGSLPNAKPIDPGYWSNDNAKVCSDQGIDAYIATGRLPHGQPPPPQRGPLPRDADAKTRMARKLRSKQGSAIYAQRKAIVEPVNGQIKEGRGIRRFLLRGLEKVDGEWHLIAATHNLLKLFRHRRSQQQAQWAATGWGAMALAGSARAASAAVQGHNQQKTNWAAAFAASEGLLLYRQQTPSVLSQRYESKDAESFPRLNPP